MAGDPQPETWRRLLWPRWSQRKKMLAREAWIFVIAASATWGTATFWPYDLTTDNDVRIFIEWMLFLVRTFTFHLGIAAGVIFIISAIYRKKGLAAAALVLTAITLVPALIPADTSLTNSSARQRLRLMSVNLLASNRESGPLIAEIRRERADVIAFQEYTERWHDALERSLAADYPHRLFDPRDDSFGIALYSRTPFQKTQISGSEDDASVPHIRAVVPVGEQPVALYNIHLLPPKNLAYVTDTRRQFLDMIQEIQSEAIPVIVTGDFNFNEYSAQHQRLTGMGLQEVQEACGRGRGSTWPVKSLFRYVPGIRLDRIYFTSEFRCMEARTGTGEGSDHRPVVAALVLEDDRR